jgi:apolipoprotein D and lipocalin family protein
MGDKKYFLTKAKIKTVLLLFIVFIVGCALLPPKTVDYVDLERYAGLWYEIARYDTPFDEDAVAVTAEYTLNDDGTVKVLNKGRIGSIDGPPTSIEGVARVVDPRTNAKLAVRFDRPEIEDIEFPYWIIELGEEYDYAVVSNPSRSVLYILSRTATMDEQFYNDLLDLLAERGFDPEKIQVTPQPKMA